MKAVRLSRLGEPVRVVEIPEPTLQSGGVLLRMQAAPVLSYMKYVLSGELGYAMPPCPFTPGTNGIARIEAVAPDVFGLKPGQRVSIDPRFITHENVIEPDMILIGLTAITPQSARLQALWPDGSFAEKALYPADCLTPLDGLEHLEAARLCCIAKFTVPYGGLLRGELRPGQTLVINGATGNLGSAAVPLGLAMGAARVVAVGRDAQTLEKLSAFNPQRVVSLRLSGDVAEDAARINAVSGGGAHVALDLVGRAESANATLACLRALRPRGVMVLMGSMKVPLALTYSEIMLRDIDIRGAFMFPREALASLAAMVAAGTLDLERIELSQFPLDRIDAALERATHLRGLEYCVLTMA